MKKYFVRQKGESDQTTIAEDIKAQITLYENAVIEVLDDCNRGIYSPGEIDAVAKVKLAGRPPKNYTHLFTLYGEHITNLIQIEHDTIFLVVSTNGKFKGLKTNELFSNDETGKNILNRMLKDSPVKIDKTSSFANETPGTITPMEHGSQTARNNTDNDLTFKLTSLSHTIATPKKGGRNIRDIALSSKQIRAASRKDLKNAKQNEALDALIQQKHKRAQSYS